MSRDLIEDVRRVHDKFGITDKISELAKTKNSTALLQYLKFIVSIQKEETNELIDAINQEDGGIDPEEVVDALVDIAFVAIGIADSFGVDFQKAWDRVYADNLAKELGNKAGRDNPNNMPDLKKPIGWVSPDHTGLHGILPIINEK